MLFHEQKHRTLKELLAEGPVLMANVFDCVSAKVVEQIGFKALNLPCDNVAASLIGMPALGMLDFDELLSVADRINNMSSLPLMVDINCGFGNEINVLRSCERMVKAGASAVILDDRRFQPSYQDGEQIVERDEFLTKIRAAKYVLAGTDCLLVAQTYANAHLGIDEAIERCRMAEEAGADITLVHGVETLEDLEKIAAQVKGCKMFEMREKKVATYDHLVALGFQVIALEFAMAGANEYMWAYGVKSKEDMSDIYAVEHSILPNGDRMTAFGNHQMFGANDWLKLGSTFSDHSQLKFAGAFLPKDE